jgi:SAM-dependent methyltransferase
LIGASDNLKTFGAINPMDILETYIKTAPTPQNALDIFEGEWSSSLPADLGHLQAGGAGLFEDPRIEWTLAQFGGCTNQRVLELGPLEGGHTYMMEKAGAASITAIEANSRAYLKCLVIKEVLGLKQSSFLYGDFVEFLKTNTTQFDICISSGVLYHMPNPAELIALAAKVTNQMMIWTHYYDAAIIAQMPHYEGKFSSGVASEYEGFHHALYRQGYGAALDWAGFCGGGQSFSNWMSREDIIRCCQHFGFKKIETNFEQPDHPNGPSFALVAMK